MYRTYDDKNHAESDGYGGWGIHIRKNQGVIRHKCEYKLDTKEKIKGFIMNRVGIYLIHYPIQLTYMFNSYLEMLSFEELISLNSQFQSDLDLLNYIGGKLDEE